MDVVVRRLRDDDVEPACELQVAGFAEHDRRMGEEVEPDTPERIARRVRRLRHFRAHDPEGSLVATAGDGGRIVGVGLASLRDDLWGLSLLVVDPSLHGQGIGRRLLAATLAYGDPGGR